MVKIKNWEIINKNKSKKHSKTSPKLELNIGLYVFEQDRRRVTHSALLRGLDREVQHAHTKFKFFKQISNLQA
jgi:dGTP triphosphohydrolase